MVKRQVGRPRKFSKKRVGELVDAFEEYIQITEIPIIVDFCNKQSIIRQNLYDYPEFSTLLKRCTEKKEANIERGMLNGEMPAAAAIFSLKQLGFSDKQEIEHSGKDGGPIRIMKAEDLSDEELASIATTGRK